MGSLWPRFSDQEGKDESIQLKIETHTGVETVMVSQNMDSMSKLNLSSQAS